MKSVKEEILRLREEGHSYREIQQLVGCSKGTIAYHIGIGQKLKTLKRTNEKRTKIARFLQEYKAARVCADCGENYPYWMLEFDHLGDKKFSVSEHRNHTIKLDEVKKEIEKCEVVCCNCHRNRTFIRQTTHAGYVGLEFCDYPK